MIARDVVTPRLALDSLRSKVCPACAGPKGAAKTFCFPCYHRLPAAMRSALYARLRAGYEEAVVDALRYLDAETFHTERMP